MASTVSPIYSTQATSAKARPWSDIAASVWFYPVVLLGLCGLLFFYGINVGEFYRTESLRAILAEGFYRSGNWVVPKLYGEAFFTKPPLMYAIIALVSTPFGGVNEITARIPSAMSATVTVFLFYWYFGRMFGRTGGFLAALIVPLSPMWLEKASAAELDMMQVMWTAGAILFFLRAYEVDSGPSSETKSLHWWLLSFLFVAAGFLTKWTTPAFFYLTVLPLLWWQGRLRLLLGRKHLAGLGLALTLSLSWVAAAIYLEGWQTFYRTVYHEAMIRLQPNYSPEPYPWGETLFHPLKLLLVTLPYSAVALWTLKPGFAKFWDERQRTLLLALHCWVWPNMLLWSLITPPATVSRYSPQFPVWPRLS